MNVTYLLLGSNLGDRESYLSKAIDLLELEAGQVTNRSALYSTAPWAPDVSLKAVNAAQGDFLNQALELSTPLSAPQLLDKILAIELKLGRKRDQKWEARIIDIDILFYNQEIIQSPDLTVPHPFLHQRRFALMPLAEIAGNFTHPLIKKSVKKLLLSASDNLKVAIHKKK